MEARSLASVNALAANPPQYPEKPHEERQDPLVLYISRVPGTRDVILSPFKPQPKNVTAEDVAASLYYVHLEAPLRQSRAFLRPEKARNSSEDASVHTIPRKPLPDSARPMTPESLLGGSRQQQPENRDSEQGKPRRISYEDSVRVPPSRDSALTLAPEATDFPRRSHSTNTGVIARKPVASQVAAKSPAAAPAPAQPPVPLVAEPNTVGGPRSMDLAGDDVENQKPAHSPSPPRRRSLSSAGAPYTLTLIRRDPSSGHQWNIGRVSSRQQPIMPANNGDSISPEIQTTASASAHQPIQIEIETSGYAKFRRLFPRRAPGTASPEAILTAAAEAGMPPQIEAGLFSRQVVMGYSKSWTATLKDKLSRLEQAGRARMNQVSQNRASFSSSSTGDSAAPSPKSNGDSSSLMKPRGYAFTSPWDGKCEFRTAQCGRTLHLRHTLHESEPTTWNPLAADQASGASGTSTVSELRFNLPTSELLGEQAKTTRDQWRGHFDKLLRPTSADGWAIDDHGGADEEEMDDVVSPFDVNVGTERAGGGNRGSRAKLGKLVVYHEGLKMLDLVVAANMGVWWQSWERMF